MTGEPAGLAADVARLFVESCRAELRALKPGNVHDHAPGHRMTVADFETSAAVAAPFLAQAGATVGARVLGAVRATIEAVGQNTNLGILLLAAPLAATREALGPGTAEPSRFRERLAAILSATGIEDAENVYAAIRLARPGGLGSAPEQDVAAAPTVTLRAAMAAAADRDRIARQYVTTYDDVFSVGIPALRRAMLTHGEAEWATVAVYFAFASRFADTHVERKHGAAVAEEVRRQFAEHRGFPDAQDVEALRIFDDRLKRRSINPGTSADLTVATLFTEQLLKYK